MKLHSQTESHPANASRFCELPEGRSTAQIDYLLDPDRVWMTSLGLDLEERSVLEAEVLMWRVANAREHFVQAA